MSITRTYATECRTEVHPAVRMHIGTYTYSLEVNIENIFKGSAESDEWRETERKQIEFELSFLSFFFPFKV